MAYRDDLTDAVICVHADEAASSLGDLIGLLVVYAKWKRSRLILGCDVNANHTRCGESILNCIILNRLNIGNVGNTPTFRNRVREAVIDIKLSNMDKSIIRDWRVLMSVLSLITN